MLISLEISPEQMEVMPKKSRLKLFEKIVKSSRLGNHRFVIPEDLIYWAENREEFSEDVRTHLIHLDEANNYLSHDQTKTQHVHLDIQYGNHDFSFEKPHKWIIGHNHLLEGNYLEPCQLLVENEQSDGRFYELILEFEKAKNRKDFAFLNYNVSSGHGKGIRPQFEKLIESKLVVCCICDSDRLAPSFKVGPTFKGVQNLVESKRFLGHLDCTPCHESENFLSIKIIRELLMEKGNKQKNKVIGDIGKLIEKQQSVAQGDCLWLYFDIKKGVDGSNILKSSNLTKDTTNWLREKYRVKKLSKISYPGIGKTVIKNFLASDKAQMNFHSHSRSNYWKKHFSPWIEQFIWYFYAQESIGFEED